MAEQKGIIPLKGTVGNITFYKGKTGYLAREKGGIDANKIANDPAFQRTRENGAEFGRAGKTAKLIRNAFKALTQNASDSHMVGRFTRDVLKAIQADVTSPRGKRNITDGDAEMLQGFEFNIEGKLGTSLYAPFTASIDRAAGTLNVTIPPFVPINMLKAPSGATHFKINSAGASFDFENEKYAVETSSTRELPWNNQDTAPINLSNALAANSTHPLLLVLGVDFFQEINGGMYSLKNGAFNPLAIVKVSKS